MSIYIIFKRVIEEKFKEEKEEKERKSLMEIVEQDCDWQRAYSGKDPYLCQLYDKVSTFDERQNQLKLMSINLQKEYIQFIHRALFDEMIYEKRTKL